MTEQDARVAEVLHRNGFTFSKRKTNVAATPHAFLPRMSIALGLPSDAARLMRQLVRHLRANGRIPHESLYI